MFIAYMQDGKEFVTYIPYFTAEEAVGYMGLEPGTWRKVTKDEALELMKPTTAEQAAQEAYEQQQQKAAGAQEFLLGMMEEYNNERR